MGPGGIRATLAAVGHALDSGIATLAIGAVLLVTGLFELADTALEQALGIHVGAHHGVIVWGIAQMLRGLSAVTTEVTHVRQGVRDVTERSSS